MPSSLELEFDWRGKRFYDAAQGLNAAAAAFGRKFDNVPQLISKELRSWLEDVAEALAQRHGQPWPGGTGPKTLSRRSGFMIASIKESVRVQGQTIPTIEGYISVPHTRKIHENGGVIRPVKAKYLTIPLPAALNSNGTPKKPSARAWQNTFVLRSKAGNLLIVQRRGTQLVPLYVLKSEVYIPPRLGMMATAQAGMTMLADSMTNAILKEMMK